MKENLENNIVIGLERISEAFKVLLREKAKQNGLSPIQIQILLFIADHQSNYCNVSQLAREFDVTKPTISDAVKILHSKGYVEKDFSSADNRSYTLFLTSSGQKIIAGLDTYSDPIKSLVGRFDETDKNKLYSSLTDLVYQLNQHGILTVQRNCFSCKFYSKSNKRHHCAYLKKELLDREIRLDCAEHIEA